MFRSIVLLTTLFLIATTSVYAQGKASVSKAEENSHLKELLSKFNSGALPKLRAPNIKPITVTGEVVEIWCYTSETMGPGRGKEHLSCAGLCAAGGVPLAIVDDNGEIYLAAKSSEPYKGCFELLAPYLSKRVKAAGFVAAKKGIKVLKITSVQAVKSK